MTSVRSLSMALLSLLLFSSLLSAFQLNVTVVDSGYNPVTYLSGSMVQIMVGNTALYSQTADGNGTAYFNLSAGSYFVQLSRTNYPNDVFLVTMNNDTAMQASMSINPTSYILYGQVIDQPPSRWEGATLSLLDNGNVVRTATVAQNGYYIIPYLDTTQTYQLRLESGSHLLSAPFSFNQPSIFYYPFDVNSSNVVNATPSIFAPPNAPLFYPISATVRAGPFPMANQSVTVSTPDGVLVLTTDATGTVTVNSAAAGDYTFTWNNQSVTTTVAPLPTVSLPAPPTTPSAPTTPTLPVPSSSTPAPAGNDTLLMSVGLGVIAIIVIIFVVVFMVILGPRIYRMLNKPSAPPKASGPSLSEQMKSASEHAEKKDVQAASKPHAGHHPAHSKHKAKR